MPLLSSRSENVFSNNAFDAKRNDVTYLISLSYAKAISVVPPPISTFTKSVAVEYRLKKY